MPIVQEERGRPGTLMIRVFDCELSTSQILIPIGMGSADIHASHMHVFKDAIHSLGLSIGLGMIGGGEPLLCAYGLTEGLGEFTCKQGMQGACLRSTC